jgi:hypothetical protein
MDGCIDLTDDDVVAVPTSTATAAAAVAEEPWSGVEVVYLPSPPSSSSATARYSRAASRTTASLVVPAASLLCDLPPRLQSVFVPNAATELRGGRDGGGSSGLTGSPGDVTHALRVTWPPRPPPVTSLPVDSEVYAATAAAVEQVDCRRARLAQAKARFTDDEFPPQVSSIDGRNAPARVRQEDGHRKVGFYVVSEGGQTETHACVHSLIVILESERRRTRHVEACHERCCFTLQNRPPSTWQAAVPLPK